MRITKISILFILLSFALAPSYAQDFEVSPVLMNFSVEPGGAESKTLTIRNHGDKTQAFALTVSDMIKGESGEKIMKPAGTTKRSCADWMTVNPMFCEINPNESVDVEVLMTVPKDGYSTRWAVIYVRAAREQTAVAAEKVVATGLIISPRIAVHVFQSPKSNTKYKGMIRDLEDITTSADSLRKFTVMTDNIGDKRISGKVYLIISNLETSEEIKEPPVMVSLFPDESTRLNLSLANVLTKGTYSIAAIFDYGGKFDLEGTQIQIEIE